MDREELVAFLKENLRIETEKGCGGDYYSNSTRLRIKLMLGTEVISETFEDLVEGKTDSSW